jgi:hypothetical protein
MTKIIYFCGLILLVEPDLSGTRDNFETLSSSNLLTTRI